MADLPAPTLKKVVEVSSKSKSESSVVEKIATGETVTEPEVQRKKAPVAEEVAEDPGNEVLANFFQSLLAKKPGD
jgi:hypothetical protein